MAWGVGAFSHSNETATTILVPIVASAAPGDATVARLGGDEFAILVENADRDTAMRVAERVVHALDWRYTIGRRELFVTASVGVLAFARDRQPTSTQALRDADTALYAAKAAGKNRAMWA